MNKSDFVTALSNRTGLSKKDSGLVYDSFLEIVKDSVSSGQAVNLQGVGKFKFSQRDARVGRNPHTGESVSVPAKTYVAFQLAWKFKQSCADITSFENEIEDSDDE